MDGKKVLSLEKSPTAPAVYFFKDKKDKILYIGKAANLKNRLLSHFKSTFNYKNQNLYEQTKNIFYIKTDSPFEALLLEAKLIKAYQPKYNVKLKDDKGYPYIAISREKYPRVFMTRRRIKNALHLGPFTNNKVIREVLKVSRSIFPFRSCRSLPKKPCLYYHLKLCPAPCFKKTPEYQKTVKNLIIFLTGKEKKLLKNFEKKMAKASQNLEFEKADFYKKQIEKIQETIRIAMSQFDNFSDHPSFFPENISQLQRIECIDISSFAGQEATGSLVVFKNGKPSKKDYRRFKIKEAS